MRISDGSSDVCSSDLLGTGDHLVEVVHIGLVVLAVVEVDGFAGNVRLQRRTVVGQGGQFDGHGWRLEGGGGLQYGASTPTPMETTCRFPNASRPSTKATRWWFS